MSEDVSPEQMRELVLLHREYKTAISAATDRQEKRRLYRILQELSSAIERSAQRGEKAS